MLMLLNFTQKIAKIFKWKQKNSWNTCLRMLHFTLWPIRNYSFRLWCVRQQSGDLHQSPRIQHRIIITGQSLRIQYIIKITGHSFHWQRFIIINEQLLPIQHRIIITGHSFSILFTGQSDHTQHRIINSEQLN